MEKQGGKSGREKQREGRQAKVVMPNTHWLTATSCPTFIFSVFNLTIGHNCCNFHHPFHIKCLVGYESNKPLRVSKTTLTSLALHVSL